MAKNIKDKIIVITGGAAGIGYAIADQFLKKGAKVTVLLDVNEEEGKNAQQTLEAKYGRNKAVFYKCDVTTDLEAVSKKIFDTYKYVDVLVNNAGVLNDVQIKNTIDINVTAVIKWSYAFREHMSKTKGGKGGTIINMASVYGYMIDPYLPVYKASKFAVVGFTKSLGHMYNYDMSGVRLVAICPGFTETKFVTDIKSRHEEQTKVDFAEFMKSQDWQKVDDVGKAAVDVFEKAESGTAWAVIGGRPIVQV